MSGTPKKEKPRSLVAAGFTKSRMSVWTRPIPPLPVPPCDGVRSNHTPPAAGGKEGNVTIVARRSNVFGVSQVTTELVHTRTAKLALEEFLILLNATSGRLRIAKRMVIRARAVNTLIKRNGSSMGTQ